MVKITQIVKTQARCLRSIQMLGPLVCIGKKPGIFNHGTQTSHAAIGSVIARTPEIRKNPPEHETSRRQMIRLVITCNWVAIAICLPEGLIDGQSTSKEDPVSTQYTPANTATKLRKVNIMGNEYQELHTAT